MTTGKAAPAYKFDSTNNDQKFIPEAVLSAVREVVTSSHVIDVGSGVHPDMHIDFGGATHTRFDKPGVVSSPSFGEAQDIDDAIRITPHGMKIYFLLFRSFSCFDDQMILAFQNIFDLYRSRLSGLILYDYAVDPGKINEYVQIENPLGNVALKRAEWYDGYFIHYHPQQILTFFRLSNYEIRRENVPATKNKSSPGFLIIPRT